MTRKLRLALALSALAVSLPVAWYGAAAEFEFVAPDTQRQVSMVIGSGQLIRLDEDLTSVFVANPQVADVEVKSPRLLYLTGVGVGETTLFAVDEGDRVLMSSRVKVTHNLAALQQGLARVAPGRRVTASTVDTSLVLTGEVANAQQALDVAQVAEQFVDDPAKVVNRVSVAAPTQVNLQVRIAEVSRDIDRQLGIKWNQFSVNAGGLTIGLVGGSSVSGGYGGSVSGSRGSFNVDIMLQALSEEGLVSILAQPNLTARSGQPANFLAGGEFPYQTTSDNGTNIQFKNYGVGLNFTPTVTDGNRISLQVGTEVSELDFKNTVGNVPSLRTRRADTSVDLASGQSFAIAGLMENTSSQDVSRIPGLGTIPVIGALFRSNAFKRGQTELVIIVTPVIAQPTSGKRIALPTDGYIPPNDFEQIARGRVQGARPGQVAKPLGNRRLVGASGFTFH